MKITSVIASAVIGAGLVIASPIAAHASDRPVAVTGYTDGTSTTTNRVCITVPKGEEYAGERVCANTRTPRQSTKSYREAQETARYLSCETGRKVKYLGQSTLRIHDGGRYHYSISQVRADRYNVFKVTNTRAAYFPAGCEFDN